MKFNRILALFLALVICLTAVGCDILDRFGSADNNGSTSSVTSENASSDATSVEEQKSITPLLYKLTDSDGNVAWLFGSIHVGEEGFYPLPDYVLNAFDGADSLAVEFDIVAFEKDMGVQTDALIQMAYTDGTTIKDHISSEAYSSAKAILQENGIYNFAMDYYMPVLWSSFIDSCLYENLGVESDLGVDLHLINRAYKQNKEVLDVESAEFQYGMMAGFSADLQEWLLETSVTNYQVTNSAFSLKLLMKVWAKGDLKKLSTLINQTPTFNSAQDRQLYREYENAMIVNRNLAMADYAEEALKSGKEVFICVGAAHVVGEGAMVDLLQKRGYTVETVK